MEEAHILLYDVVSLSLYVEYLVPSIRSVALYVFLSVTGDDQTIKNTVAQKIKEYVNGIAPGDYLQIGQIIKIGITETGVEYFNVISYTIDEENVTDTKMIQELETKFLFDNITWSGEA